MNLHSDSQVIQLITVLILSIYLAAGDFSKTARYSPQLVEKLLPTTPTPHQPSLFFVEPPLYQLAYSKSYFLSQLPSTSVILHPVLLPHLEAGYSSIHLINNASSQVILPHLAAACSSIHFIKLKENVALAYCHQSCASSNPRNFFSILVELFENVHRGIYQLMSQVYITSHLTDNLSVHRAHLRLVRNQMRRHEYLNKQRLLEDKNVCFHLNEFMYVGYPIPMVTFAIFQYFLDNLFQSIYSSSLSIIFWQNYEISVSNKPNVIFFQNPILHQSIVNLPFWYDMSASYTMLSTGHFVGGGKSNALTYSNIESYLLPQHKDHSICQTDELQFVAHMSNHDAVTKYIDNINTYVCRVPLQLLNGHITISQARAIAKFHDIPRITKHSLPALLDVLASHLCSKECALACTIFTKVPSSKERINKKDKNKAYSSKYYKKLDQSTKRLRQDNENVRRHSKKLKNPISKNIGVSVSEKIAPKEDNVIFPPCPPSKRLLHKIIQGFTRECQPKNFIEAGCAVCGLLKPMKELSLKDTVSVNFNILQKKGVSRCERKSETDPVTDMTGPIIDLTCKHICFSCLGYLRKKKTPPHALANGFWIGQVPEVLSNLTYVEKLLISRVRHNRCIVKVASGRYKMRANAITFQNPVPKIYNVLPPPLKEIDEILAFIFTGPCRPTKEDIERTPLLVRRNYVAKALEWLKLNHSDYADVGISKTNLQQYPEYDCPVVIDYRESIINKDREATSVHDNDDEDGVESGICSFTVQGLTGEEFSSMSIDAMKARALEHLVNDGKIMFVGHSKDPLGIFKNPSLFPSMMPWLFPYGFGGIGQESMKGKQSSIAQKRHLLMYHDKRFQTDPNFPLIAFNHEQIQQSSTGSFLTADKAFFGDIANRLLNIDLSVLSDINKRLTSGERVKPETDAEKACYKLIGDLDAVGGHVEGSLSAKKYMRNEIWSLISYIGAPSWFITLSPTDSKHPICLYFADKNIEFKPDLYLPDEAYRLVASNPVAAARFFHFMCNCFIQHVLGIGEKHPGLYGTTNGYYGTVEQQGRLTLHLHLLLWIKNSLSPQEIRDRIMDSTSDFQKRMVEYLESVHAGEPIESSLADVNNTVKADKTLPGYQDPTKTMPEIPPPMCRKCQESDCKNCEATLSWWNRFKRTTNDILSRSNYHICCFTSETKDGRTLRKGCLNSKGECKARFPRETVQETLVEPLTGALKIKKGEAWMNTFSPPLTYLMRCNTDVTSLLSGTAIKAIVAYVTDYVTKPGLTTYSIFDTVKQVFLKNSELIGGSANRQEIARSLMTKMVNALTAKMEIGSPMASLYLLGHPDHYTQHVFHQFYWKAYVREARSFWETIDNDIDGPAKVILNKNLGQYVGLSKVYDYIYRSDRHKDITLYEWIRRAEKIKRSKKEQSQFDNLQDQLEQCNLDKSFDDDDLESADELDLIGQTGGGISSGDELDIINQPEVKLTNVGIFNFSSDHPQFRTHQIQFHEDNPLVVPLFIGGTLPRRDQGDRGYYCSTMLTLFKPWRSGEDLRSNKQTWDEAFNAFGFSEQQKKLMDNFNLRYECNDARDDFSAKQKKDSENLMASWADSETLDNLDSSIMDINNNDNYDDDDDEAARCELVNNPDKIEEMERIEAVVKNAGWLNDLSNKTTIKIPNFQPNITATSSTWNTIVQTAKQLVLTQRTKNLPSNAANLDMENSGEADQVVVSDMSYINKNFKAEKKEKQKIINSTVIEFSLNKEQERAFRIVANHASLRKSDSLKMYLGGMGGTGKSQVIKALISYFDQRKESHRIMILAPTGSAAALLNGSTYHSALGIQSDGPGPRRRNEQSTLAQVRARLDGVEYIFLDEVSMLSCLDLYKISAQLAKVRNNAEAPFGGMNMIFAGDFAQLAPVGGASLYSEKVGTTVDAAMSEAGQQSAIGKALWHQVTTVVILRQNMRQTTQTPSDAKLRTALENMRYAACTDDDIQFLRTLVAGQRKDQPNIASERFRNISIIIGVNSEKDRINELGCARFAKETGQTLTHFHSVDTMGESIQPEVLRALKRKGKSTRKKQIVISPRFQNVLWNIRPSLTEGIPGILSLCLGMPVMIRNNDATELCITKGQEGHVVGWQSNIGADNKPVLETLFVELDKPAKKIQLEGLPENVVPLIRTSKSVLCTGLKNPQSINRSQVSILPNFAMTDYSSQGKTRPDNVVNLNSCRTHMAYYTALSRSSTAEGTVILQGFDAQKIKCGAKGYLRQEFRELELLDEITQLRYNEILPVSVTGKLRNIMIRQYRKVKGLDYCPPQVDQPLKWTKESPMLNLPNVTDTPWSLVKKQNDTLAKSSNKNTVPGNFLPAQGSVPIEKRKTMSNNEHNEEPKAKRSKTTHNSSDLIGLKWDSVNHSCSYDALFTILFNLWVQSQSNWSSVLKKHGNHARLLVNGFSEILSGTNSIQNVRNLIRQNLQTQSITMFPNGDTGTDIRDLLSCIFQQEENLGVRNAKCTSCQYTKVLNSPPRSLIFSATSKYKSINSAFQNWQYDNDSKCSSCNSTLNITREFTTKPTFLCFSFDGKVNISKKVKVLQGNQSPFTLPLRGIIYSGGHHFTARIIPDGKNVWYHDGIETGVACQKENTLNSFSEQALNKCKERKAVVAIYSL